jgi:hypothetical protein
MNNFLTPNKEDREWAQFNMNGSWNYTTNIKSGEDWANFAMVRADDELRKKQLDRFKTEEIARLEERIRRIKDLG